ncbi:hypothetical protein [Alloalcanivorax mobilis]|uniref:hypothetical protein n=1 Tax=Alloalcanivorax mobilis TaxID=2019569 RepID=UPI000C7764CE|nr:hypothetical protein [Alloalcanivorax mobilis]
MTDATYQQCRAEIDRCLGRPARESESLLWDNLTIRQRIMLLRAVGLSPAECGYSYSVLTVAQRHRIMRVLTEWLGTVDRLKTLMASITTENLETHWERVRGHDLDPRLREYWRGQGEQPPRERAA